MLYPYSQSAVIWTCVGFQIRFCLWFPFREASHIKTIKEAIKMPNKCFCFCSWSISKIRKSICYWFAQCLLYYYTKVINIILCMYMHVAVYHMWMFDRQEMAKHTYIHSFNSNWCSSTYMYRLVLTWAAKSTRIREKEVNSMCSIFSLGTNESPADCIAIEWNLW